MLQVDIHYQTLFLIIARTIVKLALRTCHETAAPELDSVGLTAWVSFESHSVYSHYRQTVCHGMTSHHGGPCLTLALLLLLGIVGGIADGSRVDQDVCALQRHQAGCFRIPLVPAHQYAELAYGSLYRLESEVARGEVELLVIGRVIRNVHLAILSGYASVLFYHYCRIVIQSRSTALEERSNDYHAQILGQLAVEFGRWTGNRFGKVEILYIFYLAEVERVVKFLQYNEFCATLRQVDDALSESGLVIGDVRRNVKL